MKKKYILLTIILLSSIPAKALTLRDFTSLQKGEQGYYVIGVLDQHIIDFSDGGKKSSCVEKWGFAGAWNHLLNFYNTDPTNKSKLGMNVALIVQIGIEKKCFL